MSKCTTRYSKKTHVCIGDLSKRVSIVQRSVDTGIYNSSEPSVSFDTIATVWASIDTIKGQDNLDGTNIDNKPTHIIRMRYLDIDSTFWVKYNNEYYKTLFVENIGEDNNYIELTSVKTGDISKSGASY